MKPQIVLKFYKKLSSVSWWNRIGMERLQLQPIVVDPVNQRIVNQNLLF